MYAEAEIFVILVQVNLKWVYRHKRDTDTHNEVEPRRSCHRHHCLDYKFRHFISFNDPNCNIPRNLYAFHDIHIHFFLHTIGTHNLHFCQEALISFAVLRNQQYFLKTKTSFFIRKKNQFPTWHFQWFAIC